MIADAKDGDMGAPITAMGAYRKPDGTPVRNRTRREFLEQIEAILKQDVLDIMLVSASNLEALTLAGHFGDSAVKPTIRANDATDCWGVRHARYTSEPSRPFRTASLARVLGGEGKGPRLTDLGLYSITFNNDLDADLRSLDAFSQFRDDAARARLQVLPRGLQSERGCRALGRAGGRVRQRLPGALPRRRGQGGPAAVPQDRLQRPAGAGGARVLRSRRWSWASWAALPAPRGTRSS